MLCECICIFLNPVYHERKKERRNFCHENRCSVDKAHECVSNSIGSLSSNPYNKGKAIEHDILPRRYGHMTDVSC